MKIIKNIIAIPFLILGLLIELAFGLTVQAHDIWEEFACKVWDWLELDERGY